MRIILSRKGFDSASGGCPSPIFPDGSMLALPIPDRYAPARYRDLEWRGRNLGELASRLTRDRVRADFFAHLDPDLRHGVCSREQGWRPALGQRGGSQGHLRNQGVREGDLFLFWGLFREVDRHLRPAGPDVHVLWGWLQVGSAANVDRVVRPQIRSDEWRWASRHPHLAPTRAPDPSNTLYVAAEDLRLPGRPVALGRGSGVFDSFCPALRLTDMDASGPSLWRLPSWFMPGPRRPLTYHEDPARWRCTGDRVLLQVTSPGQEFVLDTEAYPEALEWGEGLIMGGALSRVTTPSAFKPAT